MVAPYTTRSSLAQSALAMHIAHGSQVEYIVYPASDGRFSFLQASRTVRVSAWELGSLSRRTAFVPRISRFAGARVDDQRAEGDRVSCFQGARRELEDLAHALFVRCHMTGCYFCRGSHAAIYHNALAHATTLVSNFCMERIRRLDENRSMLFFVTRAVYPELFIPQG